MFDDHFLSSKGPWLGQGAISFSMAHDVVKFYLQWVFAPHQSGVIIATQDLQMLGVKEKSQNKYRFFDVKSTSFGIELENEYVGKVVGTGLVDDKTIAWEFRNPGVGFEGFEVYEKQTDGTYIFRAEFASPDQMRSTIQGKIWSKQSKHSG